MRTQDEIVRRAKASTNFFGFDLDVLLDFLDFDNAREFLKPEVAREEWTPKPLTEESVRAAMANYMQFAWAKVEEHRGLSADRSVQKITEYVWLLGDDATVAAMRAADYPQYGAPKLAVVCRTYGLPMPESSEIARMIDGLPCAPDCDLGCGR